MILDFNKTYEEQTEEVKKQLDKIDFYEIKNLIEFKKRVLTNNYKYGILYIEKEIER